MFFRNSFSIFPCSLFFIFFALIVWTVCTQNLFAEPNFKVERIDTSDYPNISLFINLVNLKKDLKNQSLDFQISEIHDENEVEMEIANSKFLYPSTSHKKELQVLWIWNSSLVSEKEAFQKALAFSKNMIYKMSPRQKMAMYSIGKEVKLLSPFGNEKGDLLRSLEKLSYKAEVGRLYDGLYNILYSTSQESNFAEKQTVVILLTGLPKSLSQVSENNFFELQEYSQKIDVPIFLIGFSKTNLTEKYNAQTTLFYVRLKELAEKSNGLVIENPDIHSTKNLWEKISQDFQKPHKYYLRYMVPHQFQAWPFFKVLVRLEFSPTRESTLASYRVQLFSFQKYSSEILIIFILLSLGMAIFFITWLLSRRKKKEEEEKEEIFKKANLEAQLAEKELEAYQNMPLKKEEIIKIKKTREIEMETEDPLPPPNLEFQNSGTLIENERTLYLREHSYRMLQLALRQASSYQKAALRIQIPSHTPQKKIYDLFLDSTLMGSGRWAHIPIADPVASPVHARIKKIDHRFVIYDMLSGSGLFLNDKKILRPMGLRDGDEIRIGRYRYTFLGSK